MFGLWLHEKTLRFTDNHFTCFAFLEAKLTALEEFRVQRDNLTEEKDQLKKTLEEERSRFARNYDELENNLVRYREKIKNDSVTMIKKMACDIQEAGKLCLTATVKEAISANIRLQDEAWIIYSFITIDLASLIVICIFYL